MLWLSIGGMRASGKITRHQAINDIIARAFVAADMPVTNEPNGPLISDNKRPDGLTLLPWQDGKPLAWDVTVICPLAASYISGYTSGAAAELAASRKCAKYANLLNSYIFQPIAFENIGTLNSSAVSLISALTRKISTQINGLRESHLFFSASLSHCNVSTLFFSERVFCVIRTSKLIPFLIFCF